MAKRANNEGEIRLRSDGRWEARYRDALGKRKSIYTTNQAEASVKLRETLQLISRDEYCEPSKLTVAAWMDTWWREYCVPSIRKNSASSSKDTIQNHIIPTLGKWQLQRLRSDHVQGFVNGLVKNKYAPATIRRIMATLKTALKQAVVNQLIIRSPAEGVKLPKLEQKEIEILSASEQRCFLELLPDTDNGRALRFILGTGLRSSELCGLRWTDIKKDVFTVNQAISTYIDYEAEEGPKIKKLVSPPKTKSGKRSIPLTSAMTSLLDVQREMQRKDKEAAIKKGLGWPSIGLVFCTPLGEPKDRSNLSRTLRQTLDKAELRHVGIHALRHTFATNAVQSGIDYRTLSELMGHSNVSFTLQTYAHSNIDIKRKAMEAMEANS